MSVEHQAAIGSPSQDAAGRTDTLEPDGGCNCGRQRVEHDAPPLLSDDLVIVARDRAREPELPAATMERALATPICPRPSRYDVVVLSTAEDNADRDARIAAEFARHEHRVFHFGDHATTAQRPAPPTLHRIHWTVTERSAAELIPALADLRQRESLEATVVFIPATCDVATARALRERWGWRVVTSAEATDSLADLADVLVTFEASDAGVSDSRTLALPPDMPWPGRWAALDTAIRATWPKASVIILTHDNLAFNRLCLVSLIENTDYPHFELIVVDNGSTDGTVDELHRLSRLVTNARLILNDHNAGFARGNNQGLAAASGDLFVLLNNDTIVPRGWLTRLARHLENPNIGIIGPATNRTCNEAQLEIPYQTYGEFKTIARAQGEQFAGERYPVRLAMMFCAAFTRRTYERLGPLDERYEVGLFEDEDYALRAKEAGLTVAWTPEVYVHHAYHASIGKLLPSGEYMRLVRLNQGRFEEKWGICWERHRPIPTSPPTA